MFATLAAALPLVPVAASKAKIAPGDRLTAYVEARTAGALGDQGRAARLFAALALVDPADRNLARRAVAAAIDSGDMRLALSVARSVPVASLGLDGRLLLVADALRRGKSGEALTLVEGPVDNSGGGFVAPLISAWAEQAEGRDGAARLAGFGQDTLIGPFVIEQRASMLLASRRVEEAMPLVTQALSAAGGRETRLRLAYAAMLARAGDRDKAQALLVGNSPALKLLDLRRPQAGIAIDTPAAGFAELLAGVAVGLTQDNQRGFPLTLAHIARHAAPANSETTILLGLLLDRQDRHAEALTVLSTVPANDPFVGDALDLTVRQLLSAKRGPEALARATRAAERSSAGAIDQARIGNVLDELGRHAEAADAYGRAAALDAARGVDSRWAWHLLRAAQLDEIDRWLEARAELKAGLAFAPDQPLLLNYLGYGSLERGENLEEAEKMIRRALELRPGDPSITDSLGWALYKRGRLPEAIEELRKAATADSAETEIHEHLGDALYRAGRRYEARFAWRAALLTAEEDETKRIEAKIASGWTEATAAP